MRLVLICFALLLAACQPSSSAPPREETLVVSVRANVGPLDPAVAVGPEQLQILYPAYHNLIRILVDPKTGADRFEPEVAESWSVTEDRLAWSFELSDDFKFSDGVVVDAEAVKFSLERLVAVGRAPSSNLRDVLGRIEVEHPRRLTIYLTRPVPSLLPILADRSAFIVNPSVMEHEVDGDKGSGWLSTNTAGSGHYQLTRYSPRDVYIFDANPHYPPPVQFKRLVFRTSTDTSIRALQLQRGDMDLAYFLPAETLSQFRADPAFKVGVVETPSVNFLAFQLEREAVADRRLREAIALAIDYEAISEELKYGLAERWPGPLMPGMLGQSGDLPRYDPERAKQIISELQAEGELPELEMIYPGVASAADLMAVFVQSSLAEIGLTVRLQRLTVPALINRLQRGNYDMVFSGWVAAYGDPSVILNAWFDPDKIGAAGNYSRFEDPQVTALLAASLREGDETKRRGQIEQIIERVNAARPYVYLVKNSFWIVHRSDIEGFSYDAYNTFDLPFHAMRVRPSPAGVEQ